jgi:hypothetical protein
MSRRFAWLPWTLAGIAIALHLVGHAFLLAGIGVGTPGDEETTAGAAGFLVAFYAFPLVGAVIATNRPENTIGWLFLATGVVLGLSHAAASYADYALFGEPNGGLPAGNWAAWTVSLLDPAFFFCIGLLLLVFPDGHLASRRWRPVAGALVVATVAMTVGAAVKPGLVFDDSLPVENPAGIAGIEAVRDTVANLGGLLSVVVGILAVAGSVIRFRRARGVERQQFKWFAFSACLVPAAIVLMALTSVGFPEQLALALTGISFAGIAVAVGIAILRYRLYEIDRIVSRTLVYTALTLILGAAYVGLVLAGQGLSSSFAGGSDLTIAVSTLAVAALFSPLRSRIQRIVDRRFYRRRYDAQRTLTAFGAQLREQVELDGLRTGLEATVRETMQPTSMQLWLRGESRS